LCFLGAHGNIDLQGPTEIQCSNIAAQAFHKTVATRATLWALLVALTSSWSGFLLPSKRIHFA
jgi:hypothetical protein